MNDAMYEQAKTKHTTSTVLSRYQDKYLKDMFETDEKGITSAAKNGSKVKVSWKKASGTDGYHVAQYSLKNGKYVLVNDYFTKETSKTFTATKGKTYYYRVRAYDVVDGEKFYASWSKMKSYKR